MCEFCDKIRKGKVNKIIYDIDRFNDTFPREWSSTRTVFSDDDYYYMSLGDSKFCPKCGNKI